MKAFRCTCGQPLFFDNSRCLACGAEVAFDPFEQRLQALVAAGDDTWTMAGDARTAPTRFRLCEHRSRAAACNWLAPAHESHTTCLSCRLTRTIPDLSRPRNAQQVVSVLEVVGADAGFLLNSDVSRVSIVSETGESLSEEYTFPLVADAWLERRRGPVVTNLATSRMIEDVARGRGCPIVRAKVGQSYAVHALLQEEAVIAGEGSGGIAVPAFHPAFDGLLTIGLVLETIARRKKSVSELVGGLPRYHNVKEKLPCPPAKVHSVVSEVRRLFQRRRAIDASDGIRVDDEHGWIQVRASTTEPMIRVLAEDRSPERARRRADEVIDFITGLIQ